MLKYLIKDMIAVLRFLPLGLIAGIIVAMILNMVNARRNRFREKAVPIMSTVCFYMYMVILLVITFFSRERGSGNGMDLRIFSTLGINERNNAYLVENILLFIPYGMVCTWHLKMRGKYLACTALGLFSSLLIEGLQYVTQRGVFQIDDILTNMLGSMVGYLLFCVIDFLCSKIRSHSS